MSAIHYGVFSTVNRPLEYKESPCKWLQWPGMTRLRRRLQSLTAKNDKSTDGEGCLPPRCFFQTYTWRNFPSAFTYLPAHFDMPGIYYRGYDHNTEDARGGTTLMNFPSLSTIVSRLIFHFFSFAINVSKLNSNAKIVEHAIEITLVIIIGPVAETKPTFNKEPQFRDATSECKVQNRLTRSSSTIKQRLWRNSDYL